MITAIGSLLKCMKFAWSWALDYSTPKFIFGLLLACQIFLNFTVIFIVHNEWLYAVWIWLFIFCDGGIAVLCPNILKRVFGSKATAMAGYFYSYVALYAVL
jgi:hypothetical protein